MIVFMDVVFYEKCTGTQNSPPPSPLPPQRRRRSSQISVVL